MHETLHRLNHGALVVAAIGGIAASGPNATSAETKTEDNDPVAFSIGALALDSSLQVSPDVLNGPSLDSGFNSFVYGTNQLEASITGSKRRHRHHYHKHRPTHTATETRPKVVPSSNATDAFTPDWWRCVIRPESSGNFDDTSGGYGILVSTWHSYGMGGVPGEYPPSVQARVALKIYRANDGFGPDAWNNTAGCGKDG